MYLPFSRRHAVTLPFCVLVFQVVALEPRYTSRKTREFVTGDVRGRLQLSSQVS